MSKRLNFVQMNLTLKKLWSKMLNVFCLELAML